MVLVQNYLVTTDATAERASTQARTLSPASSNRFRSRTAEITSVSYTHLTLPTIYSV